MENMRKEMWNKCRKYVAKQPKYTKTNPHKGRRPSAASTKGGGRLRRPPPFVDSFVGVGFRVFVLLGHIICAVGAFPDTISLPAE